ncbi:diguanylate cyclase [Thiocapsa bogorovii]|uniref:diguanylate cyclase n=1 Tax=Thiocapsa bogorovii TaxID=521689 RepID=UPI001E60CEC6|nr:diguanylate cyclase [Thiocapsa bogorovii]UHD17423.1 diguanylate cyclase [Thiocapsa bogorovii]
MRLSIRRKLFLSHFLAVLLVSGSIGTYFYYSAVQSLVESIRLRLQSSAALLGQTLDAREVEGIRDASDSDSDTYRRHLDLLRDLSRANPDIAYAYIMRRSGVRVFFVLDSDESERQALPGREYKDLTPALLRGFHNPSVDAQVYRDEWGSFMSGYSPLRNAHGEYLVGLDMRADEFERKLATIRLAGALSLTLSMILALLFSRALSVHFTRPIQMLVERCRAIAQGDADYAVRIHSGDELEELTDAFNAMSRRVIQSRMEADAAQRSAGQARDLLERRVSERTRELTDTNARLLHEVGERARAEEMLAQVARTDPLTGLMNRRAMLEQLDIHATRFQHSNTPCSILLADIDRFKSINDTFGHDAGDQALSQTAKELTQGLRPRDLVARWGGEEFLFLLPDSDSTAALVVAERVRSMVAAKPIRFGDKILHLTLSVGVASFRPDESIHHCIKAADKALYRAKRAGRDRVVVTEASSENDEH